MKRIILGLLALALVFAGVQGAAAADNDDSVVNASRVSEISVESPDTEITLGDITVGGTNDANFNITVCAAINETALENWDVSVSGPDPVRMTSESDGAKVLSNELEASADDITYNEITVGGIQIASGAASQESGEHTVYIYQPVAWTDPVAPDYKITLTFTGSVT